MAPVSRIKRRFFAATPLVGRHADDIIFSSTTVYFIIELSIKCLTIVCVEKS